MGLCTLWGHGHLSRKDALVLPPSTAPQLWWWEGTLGLGGVVGLLGCLLPPRGVRHGNAQTCRMKSHLAIGHMKFLSLLCRTTEQGRHVQSTLLVPRLPPGKVCGCSLGAPCSSWSTAKAPVLMPAQVSPCSGWLTPNETLRNLTSEVSLNRAAMGSPQGTGTLPCV